MISEVDDDTGLVLTGKVVLVAPVGTVMVSGTVATLVSLLARETMAPPLGAGALSVTVPVEESPPVTLDGLTLNAERDTLRVKKIYSLVVVLPAHQARLMFPLESMANAAACGDELRPEGLSPGSAVEENVIPPSVDRRR